MQCILKSLSLQRFLLTDFGGPSYTSIATLMKLKQPANFDEVEFPTGDRRKLRIMEKTPQPIVAHSKHKKMSKHLELMRGPELVHNRILYGDYAVQAQSGGRLHSGHIEMIRLKIARKMNDKKMFAYWRVDPPWFPVTKKGQGKRMGGGKGPIDKFVTPVKADRIIVEVGGYCEYNEVFNLLNSLTTSLPFKARFVTRQFLEDEWKEKEHQEKLNQNPFTFEYCAKNDMLGIKLYLSPYDLLWYGKYR